MFLVLFISFGIGFIIRPLFPDKYNRYLPFITSVYEGGMMAFPLYVNLFGEDNLSNIAIFDIATMLFCFSIFTAVLKSTDSGEKIKPSGLVKSASTSPVFIAVVLGIICGISGIIKSILDTDFGIVYMSVKNSVTAILNSLILILVGFDFEFERKRIKLAFRAIISRVLVQGMLLLPFLFVIRYIYPDNILMYSALLLYMSAPPSFGMQSYIETEEPGKFVAAANSLYMIITLGVYVFITVAYVK